MAMPGAPGTPPGGLFEALVRQASEAIVFAGPDGLILIWNRGAEALFGFSEADAIGRSLDLIVPERFRQAHWDGFNRAIAQGRALHEGQVRTTRALHQDGRRLYVDMSFGIVTGVDGAVLGSLAIARDATQRRAAEAALRTRTDGASS